MDGEAALLVIAQVALGFVGFGAIVTTLQPRAISSWAVQDRFRFWAFVVGSTVVIFAAVLPSVVGQLVVDPEAAWRIASSICLLFVLALALIYIPKGARLQAAHAQTMTIRLLIVAALFYFAAIGALVLNILGLWVPPQLGLYLLAVFLLQIVNAALFVRVLQFIGRRK